jgi:hypothetical protein
VRALIRPLLVWLAWAQPDMLVAGTTAEGAVWPLLAWSAWDQPATVLADTNCEIAGLALVIAVGMGSASRCSGVHYMRGPSSGLFSLGRRGLSQPLCWQSRQDMTCSGLCLLVRRGIGQLLRWRTRQMRELLWLCPLGRRGLSQPLMWRAQLRAVIWPLSSRSAWAQPATVVAGTTVEGAALASVRLVGVVSTCHCGGGNES